MQPSWYIGIPPLADVAEHERTCPGPKAPFPPSGWREGRINVFGHKGPNQDEGDRWVRVTPGTEYSYGLWIGIGLVSSGDYPLMLRLRVVGEDILVSSSTMTWDWQILRERE